jgi:hypothetical protein
MSTIIKIYKQIGGYIAVDLYYLKQNIFLKLVRA